ncbi:MAG: peptidoglycan recognition family protein [Chitinophagaceae bacterium]
MNRLVALAFLLVVFMNGCGPLNKLQRRDNELALLPRSAWGANEPKTFKQHVPNRITVHHEGTRLEESDDAARKIKAIQVWGMGKDRGWADIPYHYLIAPNGIIYEGRNPYTVGETATEYDPTGHLLITCLGNLEIQEVNKQQLEALVKLIASVSKQFSIPYTTLSTHRDNSALTTCPGKNLYAYFQNGYISNQVKALMEKD